MIGFLIWLIVVLIIAGAVLGVVRAALAIPSIAAAVAPFGGLIYALVILVIVLLLVGGYAGSPGLEFARPPRFGP